MRDKVKVLFVAANPFRDEARRELDEAMSAIDHVFGHRAARDALELVAHFATRASDLHSALLRHEPQVVHFAGRGGEPGAIYLADEHGRPRRLEKEALHGLFGVPGSLRVVVLNGYDTLPTVEALSEVVDYTIGMSGTIAGWSATLFAAAFYSALAAGRTVLTAFELGVSQLEMEERPDAAVPMRRIRRGVNLDATLVPGLVGTAR